MSDLTQFRDHARRCSIATHRTDCPSIRPSRGYPFRAGRCDDKTDHDPHEIFPLVDCPGVCSGCMPDSERALWARLASETDAYLSRPTEEPLL